jgi:hypothetical protein
LKAEIFIVLILVECADAIYVSNDGGAVMSEVRPTYDDEIDLFDFFETSWDGKWLISAFVAIALLIGRGFLLLKDAVYESKLIYSVDTIPPFY